MALFGQVLEEAGSRYPLSHQLCARQVFISSQSAGWLQNLSVLDRWCHSKEHTPSTHTVVVRFIQYYCKSGAYWPGPSFCHMVHCPYPKICTSFSLHAWCPAVAFCLTVHLQEDCFSCLAHHCIIESKFSSKKKAHHVSLGLDAAKWKLSTYYGSINSKLENECKN